MIDMELLGMPIVLSSSYDSLSDGENPQKPELEYDSIKIHNYMRVNEGLKAEFVMFLLKTKAVKFFSIGITNRKPFLIQSLKELGTNPKIDLYGQKYALHSFETRKNRHFIKLFRSKTEPRSRE